MAQGFLMSLRQLLPILGLVATVHSVAHLSRLCEDLTCKCDAAGL